MKIRERAKEYMFLGIFCVIPVMVCIGLLLLLFRELSERRKGVEFPDFGHPEVQAFIEGGAYKRLWIVTGGQTGVDRAALEVAGEFKLPARGWCPEGRLDENGQIPPGYPMQETTDAKPELRTELNVLDSDGTLVISVGKPKDGTPLTERLARHYGKPLYVIDMEEELDEWKVDDFRRWVAAHNIRTLNIGGPRESHRPGYVNTRAKEVLRRLLGKDPPPQ